MLLGLIFRGVAFEFRFKAKRSRRFWDYAFHFGSIVATLMQGMILGAFVRGIKVEGRSFAGGAFDWLTAYSVMTGVALLFGYALLGATWLVMKTDGPLQDWARKCASYVLGYVGVFLAIVSIGMPFMNANVNALWFSFPNLVYLLPVPLATIGLFVLIWLDLHGGEENRPFFWSIGVFLMGYLGLGISLWPWLVPFRISFRDAAAAAASQSFLLVGALIALPVVLAYTGFCYYLFRGKAPDESSY
jgi:cytochrome d ubiquinol oxidase subunit II